MGVANEAPCNYKIWKCPANTQIHPLIKLIQLIIVIIPAFFWRHFKQIFHSMAACLVLFGLVLFLYCCCCCCCCCCCWCCCSKNPAEESCRRILHVKDACNWGEEGLTGNHGNETGDSGWILPRDSQGFLKKVSRIWWGLLGILRDYFGDSLGILEILKDSWGFLGDSLGFFGDPWNIEGFLGILGGFLKDSWRILEGFLKDILRILEGPMGIVWDSFGILLGFFLGDS